jgi:hypothetical protein
MQYHQFLREKTDDVSCPLCRLKNRSIAGGFFGYGSSESRPDGVQTVIAGMKRSSAKNKQ